MANQIDSLKMGQKFKKTPAGEIPVDWEVKTFEDAFNFLRTGNNSRDDLSPAGEVCYIHYGDIHTKWRTKLPCDSAELPKISKSKVEGLPALQDGDLVMADASEDYDGVGVSVEVANIGKKHIVAGLHTILLRDKGSMFAAGYCGYIQYIPVVHQSLVKIATGGSVYGISKGNLLGIAIPCPPFPEQKKIVGILSTVDVFVDKVTAEIEKTEELKKGLMRQLLTRGIGHKKFKKTPLGQIPADWNVATFHDVFNFLRTANNSRDDLDSVGEVGYIHYGDIHTKWRTKLNCDAVDLPRINKTKVEGIPTLQNGDLVMADASEDYDGIGVSIEVSNIGNQLIVAGLHTILLRDKDGRFADGFRGYIQYMPVVRQGLVKAVTGVSVYSISKGNLRDITIFLPPLPEQKKITAILQELDETIAKAAKKLKKTTELKKSLMNMLLTGKVRV